MGKCYFISGHTHLSMNNPEGCVEWDAASSNLYINDASIRPTDLLPGEPMQPAEWKEGTVLDLRINSCEVEITTRSVQSGKKHARGYYRNRTAAMTGFHTGADSSGRCRQTDA